MTYPFPQGTLSAIEAVKRLAMVWTMRQAWSAICELARNGALAAYVLDRSGRSHEADRAQFAAVTKRICSPWRDLTSVHTSRHP